MRRKSSRPPWRVWLPWTVGVAGGLVLATMLAFRLSPWPGALLIRRMFDKDTARVRAALEAHAPAGVHAIRDEPYRPGDARALLDVHLPESAVREGARLPAVVWTHGGAWLSGGKDDVAPYLQLLASRGYAVVAPDYALAPRTTYPTAVHQLNDALAWIQRHADRLHIDTDAIVLAGDSAGAQLGAQMATLITNPGYAASMGIAPALLPGQLRGTILYCGIYDMGAFLARGDMIRGGLLGYGLGVTMWAYTGSRDQASSALAEMSVIDHVTGAFPPAFISGGNADPLTDAQSRPMAGRLAGLGVPVTTLFYPADHEAELGHEYQFNLDTADGQTALRETLAFLDAQVGSGDGR